MRTAKVAVASLLIFMFAPPAFADAVDVTLTGPPSISIPEDGLAHDFTYTLTNNSGGLIDSFTSAHGFPMLLLGDSSDGANSFTWGEFAGATCGASLADGASCTLIFELIPDDGSAETDADFAIWLLELDWGFNLASGAPDMVSITSGFVVSDPGAGIPEPTTLALLGLGFAGLGFSRRKQ